MTCDRLRAKLVAMTSAQPQRYCQNAQHPMSACRQTQLGDWLVLGGMVKDGHRADNQSVEQNWVQNTPPTGRISLNLVFTNTTRWRQAIKIAQLNNLDQPTYLSGNASA